MPGANHSFRLSEGVSLGLRAYASGAGQSMSSVVDAAIGQFLSGNVSCSLALGSGQAVSGTVIMVRVGG